MLYPPRHLTRRANHRHYSIIAQLCRTAHGVASARLKAKIPTLKLHRLAMANDRLRVAEPRVLVMRVPEEIDVSTVPDLNKATALAATGHPEAAAAPG
jgi:hypothetical protein